MPLPPLSPLPPWEICRICFRFAFERSFPVNWILPITFSINIVRVKRIVLRALTTSMLSEHFAVLASLHICPLGTL